MLRILFYIDSVHCGGAQRQLCHLAAGMKRRGHDVAVAVYYPEFDFFKSTLAANNVELIELRKHSMWGMIRDLKRVVSTRQIDWVIPFLDGPGIYALTTKILCRGFKVCVAERSANTIGRFSYRQRVLRRLYGAADRITTNSDFQADILRRHYPNLKDRLHTVRNCVGQEFFDAAVCEGDGGENDWDLERDWLAVVGQVAPWKNLHGLIEGMLEYRRRFGTPPRIRWAGRPAEAFSTYVQQQRRRLVETRLDDRVELLGNVGDMPGFLRSSSGLLHPSIVEGFPNAVCEAFAVGLPVLIGDISDARFLVADERGLLFDPHSADSIAATIRQFIELSGQKRGGMGAAGRAFARREFQQAVMAAKYSDLLIAPR